MSIELTDAEDAKLLALARAQRARNRVLEAAAVRDTDGRTYTATNVDLPSLQLTALQAVVSMAVSSGAAGLEAALVVTAAPTVDDTDVAVVRELSGAGIVIHRASPEGDVLDSVQT